VVRHQKIRAAVLVGSAIPGGKGLLEVAKRVVELLLGGREEALDYHLHPEENDKLSTLKKRQRHPS
jgi:hypothetical protein